MIRLALGSRNIADCNFLAHWKDDTRNFLAHNKNNSNLVLWRAPWWQILVLFSQTFIRTPKPESKTQHLITYVDFRGGWGIVLLQKTLILLQDVYSEWHVFAIHI